MEAILTGSFGARGMGAPIVDLMLLAMVVPVTAVLLDLFLHLQHCLVAGRVAGHRVRLRPLDFAMFPSVLLVATLLRLALNVASTRVVLLEGQRRRRGRQR